jgi:hypothetical protein
MSCCCEGSEDVRCRLPCEHADDFELRTLGGQPLSNLSVALGWAQILARHAVPHAMIRSNGVRAVKAMINVNRCPDWRRAPRKDPLIVPAIAPAPQCDLAA